MSVSLENTGLHFVKMHGLMNDYIYLDGFSQAIPERLSDLARSISNRHTGVGGDGLIAILPSDRAEARMRMFNADGSEAEMCGNGLRCVAKYLHDHGLVKNRKFNVETGAGILALEVFPESGKVASVRVDMGKPQLSPERIPARFAGERVVDQKIEIDGRSFVVTALSMGNPHCVVFVEEISDELVTTWGPRIETSEYFPQRVNVEFVQVLSPHEAVQRTWERGSGETLACGTGASAVCVAGVLTERTGRRVTIQLRGGSLKLEWDERTGHVFKTGPAVEVFRGEWNGHW